MKLRFFYFSIFAVCLTAFLFFYLIYVPLIVSFQIILLSILAVLFLITSIKIKWGVLSFIFLFPLLNNLPYFFSIYRNVPHAPTALVLFLVFFLGCLFHLILRPFRVSTGHPIFKPLMLFVSIVFMSGIVTFFRYTNFYPFLADRINEIIVNVNGVRTGGALMSDVLTLLNYFSGFLFFLILFNTIKSNRFIIKILIVLSASSFIIVIFALMQKYYSLALGNSPFWINLKRINSTLIDPNSFGVFLASCFPLFLGMFLAQRRYFKIPFMILVILSIFVFPSSGSRSGLLGGIISLVIFIILAIRGNPASSRKKIIYISALLLLIMAIFSFIIFVQSNLSERINWSLDNISEEKALTKIFTGKLDFWKTALVMTKRYPLTGVGVGAFIIEMPNYLKLMGAPYRHTDSAENYFFQGVSELGLIGIFLILWIFFEIIKSIRVKIKIAASDKPNNYLIIGIISGIVSIIINFLFHSYIGSFEVKYLFWLLIALLICYQSPGQLKSKKRFGKKFTWVLFILPIMFGIIHLKNSHGSLSLTNFSEKYKINQNFGLYSIEKDNRGYSFNWTKKRAGLEIKNVGSLLVIPITASHPYIEKSHVGVNIFLADKYFRKKELIKHITIKKKEWKNIEIETQHLKQKKIYLLFETNKIWQPKESLGESDLRWLGIGLGRIWFKYPKSIPEDKIKNREIIPFGKWEGKRGHKLWENGVSKIEFKSRENSFALKLNLRGQNAFNIGPYFIVRLDDIIIARSMLTKNGWSTLIFTPDSFKGRHEISLEFINNFRDKKQNQDRNLILGDIELIYLR